ncbi:tetratricopeptide repeat protein [Bacillus carboniphilus]|uniref:Tetratricopeptide repeat protein n=1 Tax=Bacillus carboniphilus TaxID=86663 RepID=A0ABY9JXN7_9BACI|nr:tetratricopeptide repeat protein [Bacillus carboniphilus]WLR44110.1 tetratricopeptide repeat protein [Bacillus carboniphilus]
MDGEKSKIIPFPNVSDRLVSKGMDALKEKKYIQAKDFFTEALKWDKDHSEVQLGLAICLMEMGDLKEAKELCKNMLFEDQGDYFTVLQIYLSILVQSGEYVEVQSMIEALLEENKLPASQVESFYKLLHLSRKMNDQKNQKQSVERIKVDLDASPEQHTAFLQLINRDNINQHLDILQEILTYKFIHPVIKSMTLTLLKENQINQSFIVKKFNEQLEVNPYLLDDLSEMSFTLEVLNELEAILAQENPSLFEVVKEIWIRYLYVYYPIQPISQGRKNWAAALHLIGHQFHGIECDLVEICEQYQANKDDVNECIDQLNQNEEISYFDL